IFYRDCLPRGAGFHTVERTRHWPSCGRSITLPQIVSQLTGGTSMASSSVAALIMAGGRSERMRAGGSSRHKGLRTVLGVPLIECNLRALLWFGFKQLYVAVSAQERALAAWIDAHGRPLAKSQFATLEELVETEQLGTIGAVASLPPWIDDVLIVNVDNLTSLDLGQLARYHRERE